MVGISRQTTSLLERRRCDNTGINPKHIAYIMQLKFVALACTLLLVACEEKRPPDANSHTPPNSTALIKYRIGCGMPVLFPARWDRSGCCQRG